MKNNNKTIWAGFVRDNQFYKIAAFKNDKNRKMCGEIIKKMKEVLLDK